MEAFLKLPVEEKKKKKKTTTFFSLIIFTKKVFHGRWEHIFPPSSLPISFHHKSHSVRVLMLLSINDGFANGDLSLKLLRKT